MIPMIQSQHFKAIQAMNWCIRTYGFIKTRSVPIVRIDSDLTKVDGWYNFYEDTIFLQKELSLPKLIKTVIHEYQHYLKHSVKEFEYYYNVGYDYTNHPFEIEAEKIAKKDWIKCKNDLNLEIENGDK
jgi:hypothetical protein